MRRAPCTSLCVRQRLVNVLRRFGTPAGRTRRGIASRTMLTWRGPPGRGLVCRSFADLRRMDPEAGEPVASGDSPCFPDDPWRAIGGL